VFNYLNIYVRVMYAYKGRGGITPVILNFGSSSVVRVKFTPWAYRRQKKGTDNWTARRLEFSGGKQNTSFAPARNRTSNRPGCNLVPTLNEVCWLPPTHMQRFAKCSLCRRAFQTLLRPRGTRPAFHRSIPGLPAACGTRNALQRIVTDRLSHSATE
jgi:hypothetical protein